MSLVNASSWRGEVGALVIGVVGKDDGETAAARRPLRRRPRRAARAADAAHRGLPGGRLAPAGLASRARHARRHLGDHRPRRRGALVADMSADRAVFLDRDGVLNELVLNPRDRRPRVALPPRGRRAHARAPPRRSALLRTLDVPLAVVSNQPSAAKGTTDLEALAAVHDAVIERLAEAGVGVDEVRYCFHHPAGADPELGRACDCRKPAPGLILQAADALGLDAAALGRSWLIGDSDVDVEAGRAAGLRTVLVEDPRSSHRRAGADGRRARRRRARGRADRRRRDPHHPRRGGTMTLDLSTMRTKIFADGADLESLLRLAEQPHIKGFTTNPTLMRKAGRDRLRRLRARGAGADHRPPDLVRGLLRRRRRACARQAREIASWGAERLREDPGHQHARRADDRPRSASCRPTACR